MYSSSALNEEIISIDVDVDVVNILVADRDPLVRRGIQNLLHDEKRACVVGEAVDIQGVIQLLDLHRVDTLLIVFNLIAEDDFLPLRNLRRDYPECQIIVMGTDINSEFVLRMLRMGASGYLPKRGTIEDFRMALSQVLVGMSPLLPDIAQQLLGHVIKGESPIEEPDYTEALSARENEVLQCLMKGMSNKEIAHSLKVKNRTVKAHVSNILRKMQVADRTQAVLKAMNSSPSYRM